MDPGVRRESFPAVPGMTVVRYSLNAGSTKTKARQLTHAGLFISGERI
jgi:hypothetical protein